MSGEEFVQEIRKTSSVHIIVISAKGRAIDKVEVLGFGADDYLIKPFIEQELIIKLRNYFGKKDTNPSGISIHDGEISFVKGNNSLVINSKQVLFTAVEYLIVELLFERINTIITRDTFMDALYDYDKDITDRVIDVHIRNIRKKISKHSDLKPIKTVYGLGYKLEGDVDA
jgi:DNA-binding response OmpR family regulator